ncbi:cytochrome d ubiquinol oxidase subunit II [Streptomyces armeniacus]|uniref:Cytochrome d ubiquinol oxidase subunit II n=1 Tax=Streptomyces armeniacus TaxID=83291 RepID=A0A345XS94_9ACTN|nr:cytochrome d ubiquinol oxidase subunit II [Streptomyces armeniacus]AXK34510.1 cytochrome d ubiquinol oxidase subunit II [Streptomyces armeniacus]
MQTLAVVLLAVFTVGWFVLSGAGVGVGMVLPWLARGPYERGLVRRALTPSLRADEALLVLAAGALVGCFPESAVRLWDDHLPALAALLLGLAARDAGLWGQHGARTGRGSRTRPGARTRPGPRTRPGARTRWGLDALVVYGSWAAALSCGWLLAGLVSGRTAGSVSGVLGVSTALAVGALFAAHGLAFGALRLAGRPFERARLLAGRTGGRQTYGLTAAVLAALPLVGGARLPLRGAAAAGLVPGLLVPAALAVAAVPLAAAQLRVWRTFRDGLGGGLP